MEAEVLVVHRMIESVGDRTDAVVAVAVNKAVVSMDVVGTAGCHVAGVVAVDSTSRRRHDSYRLQDQFGFTATSSTHLVLVFAGDCLASCLCLCHPSDP